MSDHRHYFHHWGYYSKAKMEECERGNLCFFYCVYPVLLHITWKCVHAFLWEWPPNIILTRWVPTTSILVVIRRIYRYQFNCNWNSNAVQMLTSPKSCWDLQKSTFILLSHHFEPTWVRKNYFLSDLRF